MIGKILFVDDECVDSKSGGNDEEKVDHVIRTTVKRLEKENSLSNACCEIAENFADAVKKIIDAKDGRDYSWFILDRNLESFSDIKNISQTANYIECCNIRFNKAFFESLKGFEGDYLYFLLRKNGVPLEKICFLTANDYTASNEKSELRTTHLCFETELPKIIVKESKKSKKTAYDDDDDGGMDKDEENLFNLIKNSLEHQICFRHKDFLESQYICSIFGKSGLLHQFKNLLVKIEKNEEFENTDGTILRNMLEIIIDQWLSSWGMPADTVRGFLNDSNNGYSNLPNRCKNWLDSFNHYGHFPNESDLENLKNYYSNEKKAKGIIHMSHRIFIAFLGVCYRANNQPPQGLPPKYIFSYIDNIYTVTSEWSSHGRNLIKTQELSQEGWKTLVLGMCQILQWVAKENPNPTT